MTQLKRNYKRALFGLIMLLTFSNAYAVFEGRNTKPNDLPGIRNHVEMASIENQSQKATGLGGTGNVGDGDEVEEDPGPISDSPLFFLLLGGLSYGVYAFRKKMKVAN